MNPQQPTSQYNKNERRMPQKIDRAYILSMLLIDINRYAVEGSSRFILSVNALEDNLAPHDPKYKKSIKDINKLVNTKLEEAENSDDHSAVIQHNQAQLEWKRARAKLQLLNDLLKRSGLEKEMRYMLNESYEEEETNEVEHEIQNPIG